MKITSSDAVCKPKAACDASGHDGVIRIEHSITDDLPDGRPTVPVGDHDSFWARVAPLTNSRTQWRRIDIQPHTALPIGVADDREPQTP
jgi:hypothetical protein